MKCQYCEKPATFHITELTEPAGPQVMHLCETHAKQFLQKEAISPTASIAGVIAKQLQLGQSKEEIDELDQKECPVCGISFFEFRSSGRLGCPYDYSHFESDLQPLLINIHDATEHTGKRPRRAAATADTQAMLIQLRREMEEAVDREDYERASEVRDRLRQLEPAVLDRPAPAEGAPDPAAAGPPDAPADAATKPATKRAGKSKTDDPPPAASDRGDTEPAGPPDDQPTPKKPIGRKRKSGPSKEDPS